MPTAKEYRQQAQLYAKEAMTELAEEFNKAAEVVERKSLSDQRS